MKLKEWEDMLIFSMVAQIWAIQSIIRIAKYQIMSMGSMWVHQEEVAIKINNNNFKDNNSSSNSNNNSYIREIISNIIISKSNLVIPIWAWTVGILNNNNCNIATTVDIELIIKLKVFIILKIIHTDVVVPPFWCYITRVIYFYIVLYIPDPERNEKCQTY